MLRFDHVAIGADTLAAGADWLRARVGAAPPAGGAHPLFATHNLLTATGPDTFLEVIARDPGAKPQRRRWFGLDDAGVQARLAAAPRPHAVVLACADLDSALSSARRVGLDLGEALTVTRGPLTWRFAVRDDGAIPLDGAAPLLMEWPDGPHPAGGMTDLGLRYVSIETATPHADVLTRLYEALGGAPAPLTVRRAPTLAISVTLTDRDGVARVLSAASPD